MFSLKPKIFILSCVIFLLACTPTEPSTNIEITRQTAEPIVQVTEQAIDKPIATATPSPTETVTPRPTETTVPVTPTIMPTDIPTTVPPTPTSTPRVQVVPPITDFAPLFDVQVDETLFGSFEKTMVPIDIATDRYLPSKPHYVQLKSGRMTLRVYPIDMWVGFNPYVNEDISELQDLLLNKQALPSSGDLPYLPLVQAAQMMSVQGKYVPFQNGEGIRYLTSFSQAVVAPPPQPGGGGGYTFQGITADGNYYVSFSGVRVSTDEWVISEEEIGDYDLSGIIKTLEDSQRAYELFTLYVQGLVNLPESAFDPIMGELDAFVQSIEVIEVERQDRRTNANGVTLLTALNPLVTSSLTHGEVLPVYGYADPSASDMVTVTLHGGGYILWQETVPIDPESGDWGTELVVPETAVGNVSLNLRTDSQTSHIPLEVIRPETNQAETEPLITIYSLDDFVPNAPFYVRGIVKQAVSDEITASLLANGCTQPIATSTTTLDSRGAFLTVITPPAEVQLNEGTCIVVHTGEIGSETWFMQIEPIDVGELYNGLWFEQFARLDENGELIMQGSSVGINELSVTLQFYPNAQATEKETQTFSTLVMPDGLWQINPPVEIDHCRSIGYEFMEVGTDVFLGSGSFSYFPFSDC